MNTRPDFHERPLVRPVCLFHRGDLDGHCSGALVKLFHPAFELIGLEYGDPIPFDRLEGASVFLVDFCLEPFSHMQRLFEIADSVLWIDHHRTAIDAYHAHCEANGEPDNVRACLQEGQAACKLAFRELFPLNDMPWPVRALGLYDVWKHEDDPLILNFQYGMRLETTDPRLDEGMHLWRALLQSPILTAAGIVDHITDKGATVLEYQRQQDQRLMNAAFEVNWCGHRWLAVNASGRNSLAFRSKVDPERHTGLMTFSRLADGRWRFTLYHAQDGDTRDFSAYAKAMGGGGHPGACGFVIDADTPKNTIPNVFLP